MSQIQIEPQDQYNQELVSQVHPSDWQNPKPEGRYNMVVIGGGTAGLVTAAGTAGLGGKVALIERHLLGGDCLNMGCVPSKALIRSGAAAYEVTHSEEYGIFADNIRTDFGKVMERMRRLRSKISHHDSAERFQGLGVDIFLGDAKFTGPDSIEVGGQKLEFKKAAICTGARAFIPPVEGLRESDPLTNETVFSLTEKPNRMVVMGGGPIGAEMAQTFARLGVHVSMIEMSDHILAKDDPEAAAVVQEQFEKDGINLLLNAKFSHVEREGDIRRVTYEKDGGTQTIETDQILVAVGRAPNVEGMGLEAANVEYDVRQGVKVNDQLQTTNPNIFAVGDCAMKFKFTHAADAAARLVIRNATLPVPNGKLSDINVPWCTYTDPELAHVGLNEEEAKKSGIEIDTFKKPFADVDRAILEGDDAGFVKIHVHKGTDKIVGGTIVGRHAGDLIGELNVAMTGNIGLGKLASIVHPYPTRGEALKQVGDMYNRTRLSPTMKSLFTKWYSWRR